MMGKNCKENKTRGEKKILRTKNRGTRSIKNLRNLKIKIFWMLAREN